ncbi:MAG: desulfoferrodoxin [Elusimicrobia bacterium RIFOXYB2_FULL_49_7]|nr:MAG: desulfoferrodoxin [Elusimicrobia bacterium RIFOXYB2_FULL_49_7]
MVKALKQVFKCALCGNIVEVVHVGGGTLVCCGQNMTLLEENTVEAAKEKHVPVVEVSSDKVTVKVGSVAHPMNPDHYIEFIELLTETGILRQFLKPGDHPVAVFSGAFGTVSARAYCNLHGLWKS